MRFCCYTLYRILLMSSLNEGCGKTAEGLVTACMSIIVVHQSLQTFIKNPSTSLASGEFWLVNNTDQLPMRDQQYNLNELYRPITFPLTPSAWPPYRQERKFSSARLCTVNSKHLPNLSEGISKISEPLDNF